MASFAWTFPQPFTRTNWLIDGRGAGTVISESATDKTLTLQARVTDAVLRDAYRPLKQNEGQVDVVDLDNGGFSAVDRANGNNTYTLDPPIARSPLRQTDDYHVRRYEEDLVSQTVNEWTVEVEFVLSDDRDRSPSIDDAVSGAAFDWTFDQAFTRNKSWGFTTRYGTIATDRVDAEFLGTGADGVERFELSTRMTHDESHVFEQAFARLGGTRVRPIADSTNLLVDETSGDVNTVTVDSPTPDTVSDGDYVITEWSTTRLNDAFSRVEFTMGPAG